MSLDAMEQVSQAEQRAVERRAEAEAEAKKIAVDAERQGRELLAATQERSDAEGKQRMAAAEAEARARAGELSRLTEQENGSLRARARTHLPEAAHYIVEKVVNH